MDYVFPSDQDRADNQELNKACEYIEHLLDQQSAQAGGVPEDLYERCVEIRDWKRSGICKQDGILRALADTLTHFDEDDRMRMAESQTYDDLVAFVTAAPTAPSVEGDRVPVGIVRHRTDPRSDNPDAYIKWLFGGDEINIPDGTRLYTHPHNGEQGGECEPDLFWNADCPEDDGERAEFDLADRCGQDLQAGKSMVIDVMCAKELPTRQMLVWVDENGEIQWEWQPQPPMEDT